MEYLKYHEYKNKYHKAQESLNDIISEKEHLFAKTQPKATDFSKEPVTGGKKVDSFTEYTAQVINQKINERLEEARSILADRKMLLLDKEDELRRSKDWYDKIYTYRFLDKYSIEKIKNIMPYCRSSIYNKLEEIEKKLGLDKNGQIQ